MKFINLHNRIKKLESARNPHNWVKPYLVYVQFLSKVQAEVFAKNLLANFYCSSVVVRPAKRFTSGYELKINGLLASKLNELVSDFEAIDRYNSMTSENDYFDLDLRYEQEFQLAYDRAQLEQDIKLYF